MLRRYRDKTVLVTGHTGFKGSWLCAWLTRLGARVAGLSAYLPSDPCHFEAIALRRDVAHYTGDVRDLEGLRKIFARVQPDVVFHLAAQPIVRLAYQRPKEAFDINLGGTVNVLECIRSVESIRAAVLITSDKCYRNHEWPWGYREGDPLGGDDPYSASKACAEMAVHAYQASYFADLPQLQIATARAGNVIGGGDWAEDRIVPDCVRAFEKGDVLILRHPHATRPWQHVLEPVSAYLLLGATLLEGEQGIAAGESFNFGPLDHVNQTVAQLVGAMSAYWEGARFSIEEASEMKEAGLLKLDCEKARKLLGWQATLDFEETVAWTADWYRQYRRDRTSIRNMTLAQIERYSTLAKERGAAWLP